MRCSLLQLSQASTNSIFRQNHFSTGRKVLAYSHQILFYHLAIFSQRIIRPEVTLFQARTMLHPNSNSIGLTAHFNGLAAQTTPLLIVAE